VLQREKEGAVRQARDAEAEVRRLEEREADLITRHTEAANQVCGFGQYTNDHVLIMWNRGS